jgi:hypothetical protein
MFFRATLLFAALHIYRTAAVRLGREPAEGSVRAMMDARHRIVVPSVTKLTHHELGATRLQCPVQ